MYNVGARGVAPAQQMSNAPLSVRSPRPLGSTSSLGGATSAYAAAKQNASGYNYPDTPYAQYNSAQYGQYGQYSQYPKYPATTGGPYGPMMPKPKNEMAVRHHQAMPTESSLLGRDSGGQDTKSYGDQNRQHFVGSQNSPHYPNGGLEQSRVDQYSNDNVVNRGQNGDSHPMTATETPPARPSLPEETGFNESPPPPPPNTSTHPLYNKQADTRYVSQGAGGKHAALRQTIRRDVHCAILKITVKKNSFRYTASMQDPPRGSYYPAGGIGAMQQPRQYQYSATNPWQREEREKVIKTSGDNREER